MNLKAEFSYHPVIEDGFQIKKGLTEWRKQGRLLASGKSLRYIRLRERLFLGREITNLWTDTSGGSSGKVLRCRDKSKRSSNAAC